MARRTIIVGGGIAGLWLADRLSAAGHPVTVLEKYDYLGGRIVTARDSYDSRRTSRSTKQTGGHTLLEIGAGRVHESHRHVAALLRRFRLHRIPLSDGSLWRALGGPLTDNTFYAEFAPHLVRIMSMPHTQLRRTTLSQLVPQAILDKYPYRAEVETLRADVAIHAFLNEMSGDGGFYVVREGLSAITRGLVAAATARGAVFLTGQEVTHVSKKSDDHYQVHTKAGIGYTAERVILALHASALRHIRPVASLPVLQKLAMEPLTRIYARYPTAWFKGPRVVTDSPLRYVIPMNPAKGIVMISYTDGRDTRYWTNKKQITAAVQREVRRLFPELEIPDPLWVRAYPWDQGCTYWKPGDYDPATESKKALHPLPDTYPELYMCGESFSVGRQAWIEGALEHAEALLRLLPG